MGERGEKEKLLISEEMTNVRVLLLQEHMRDERDDEGSEIQGGHELRVGECREDQRDHLIGYSYSAASRHDRKTACEGQGHLHLAVLAVVGALEDGILHRGGAYFPFVRSFVTTEVSETKSQ